MIQGMSYQQLNWQMKERLTKRDQPSILYDASQSVFSGDGLISESVNEDELHAAWTKEEAAIATRPFSGSRSSDWRRERRPGDRIHSGKCIPSNGRRERVGIFKKGIQVLIISYLYRFIVSPKDRSEAKGKWVWVERLRRLRLRQFNGNGIWLASSTVGKNLRSWNGWGSPVKASLSFHPISSIVYCQLHLSDSRGCQCLWNWRKLSGVSHNQEE